MNAASLNIWLIAAGLGSIVASLAHVACIIGGPDWYRFMGAGEQIASAAERGAWMPALVTLAIAGVLAAWAAYAFSAAGIIAPLPFTRTALILISAVLIVRASAYFIGASWRPDLSHSFIAWSSLIVLLLGFCFAFGTWRAWRTLSAAAV